MRYMLYSVALLFAISANAQFVKHEDELGNITYTDDPRYDYSQDELDASQLNEELEEIEEFLRARGKTRQLEQARKQSRNSSIGIGHDPTGVTQWIRYRKCYSLWRLGLKCL